jgi:hypothetical protein
LISSRRAVSCAPLPPGVRRSIQANERPVAFERMAAGISSSLPSVSNGSLFLCDSPG